MEIFESEEECSNEDNEILHNTLNLLNIHTKYETFLENKNEILNILNIELNINNKNKNKKLIPAILKF